MNYEQKYKEALKELREHFLPTTDGTPVSGISRRQIEDIFPELKESEDERIRKALLNEFIHLQSKGYKFAGLEGEEIVNWLEKQGELVNSLSKGLDNAHERIDELIQNNNSLMGQLEKKQGEQNPAWSEEDEFMRKAFINLVEMYYGGCIDKQEKNKMLDWLKSLKDRYTWKLSEEQMEALVRCVDYLEDSDNEDLLVMESLLEQLKAL